MSFVLLFAFTCFFDPPRALVHRGF